MKYGTKGALAWILLITLSVIWGSSFILMFEGLKAYTSTQLATLRICVAGMLFLPFGIYNIFRIEKGDLKWFALSGLLGNFIPAYCFAYAQTYIQSSTAGALNSLTPFFTLLVGILLFSKVVNKYKIIGILIGLIGAISLIVTKPGGGIETNYAYGGLIIISTIFYGLNVNIIENKLSKYNYFFISSIPLSLVFFLAVIGLNIFDFPFQEMLSSPYVKSTVAIATLGLLGTGLSLILFNKLIQITNGLFASTVTYMMPIVSTFWGIYYNESVGLIQLTSLGLILLGVFFVKRY